MTEYSVKKDNDLVELTLLGDERAFEELVRRHEYRVKATAYKVTGNSYSAEDASQDAFVSAWVNLDRLADPSRFGSWICAIAKNHAKDLVIHYKNAVPDISFDLLENTRLEGDDENTPADLLGLSDYTRDLESEKLHTAVEALSEKIREAVKLHYFEDLSISEIAARLSLPAGTVKWRLSEGRRLLRKEYGVMEKTYNENESLVERVMRQVEELKLWALKNDKSGFAEDYEKVLANVEALAESTEKQHALADVLVRGYWWLPGKKNDELLARIKAAAEAGHNDDVMQSVVAYEGDKYYGQKKIDFFLNTEIPYLEEKKFIKSLGYTYFWLAHEYVEIGQFESAIENFRRVLDLLTPADVYYANALAAIKAEEKILSAESRKNIAYDATGEVYRRIGNRLYFWQQPGYSNRRSDDTTAIFWFPSLCDGIIFDDDLKLGETITASDKNNRLTYKENGVTVDTPVGRFESCQIWVFEGNKYGVTYVETAFCPGVGIVKQRSVRYDVDQEWALSAYTVKGGDGLVPFAAGNRWEYIPLHENEFTVTDTKSTYEVTSYENGRVVLSHCSISENIKYKDTWAAQTVRARREYVGENDKAVSVEDALCRAEELAKTKRQKVHTAVANNVMRRIFATAPEANPDYTEKGKWNFFEVEALEYNDNYVKFGEDTRTYAFEWKEMWYLRRDGLPVFYNFLYDVLYDWTDDLIWSEEWVPGYRFEKDSQKAGYAVHVTFEVLEDEDITIGLGEFKNCRHILLHVDGLKGTGYSYRGGYMNYWYAPGVGIVKFTRKFKPEHDFVCTWELTDYRGTGEGYFPVGDGFFRRYEPLGLVNGWHGSVEYTFDEDESGMVVFRNALGTQDRANYEADLIERERQKKEKEEKEKQENKK